ncbi:glycoside hydrolase family 43 protein [Chitinophaga caseinilytica]|uniref:glycoside hydrolase family 43 protein n=1 Tax=Chitinophaga caseinilytica TaxID=2267521 RepID=UPI003C2D89AC
MLRKNASRCGRFFVGIMLMVAQMAVAQVKTADLRIRDPFVFPDPADSTYYLYANENPRIAVYKSRDLENWEKAGIAFEPPAGFWGTKDFWAPDVYKYRGKFYMLATFSAPGRKRGTSILVGDHPAGPFAPLKNGPATPDSNMCLDGIIYTGKDGKPWLVWCWEWLEVGDGRIMAQRLSRDLNSAVGKPIELIRAGDAPWTGPVGGEGKRGIVTDGPFFHRMQNGEMIMIWSSFTKAGKYAIGVARSESGELKGPWKHDPEPLNTDDGGHAMLFRDFSGQLRISFHAPNGAPHTRVRIHKVTEENGKLKIIQ